MNGSTELRKLPAGHLFRLAQILESGEAWKRLMSVIPKSDVEGTTELKYKMEHIELIERASATQRRRCSEIFLEEWSTSGRRRPDLAMLLLLLEQTHLYRAAEFVAIDLLEGVAPTRPETGPSAVVDISDETIEELSRLQLRHFEEVKRLNETACPPAASVPVGLSGPYEGLPLSSAGGGFEQSGGGRSPNVMASGDGRFINVGASGDIRSPNLVASGDGRSPNVIASGDGRLPNVLGSGGGISSSPNVMVSGDARSESQREADLRHEANTDERLMQIQETIQIESLYVDPMRIADVSQVVQAPPPSFDTQLPHFPYADLEAFTDNFCDIPLTKDGGRKLGTGAFGSVYLAILPMLQKVAVKRLNRDAINMEKQFRNEVEALSKFCHPNLLPLLGYCCDGPNYCLVYEYMCNGSLQERLAQKQGSQLVLPWWLRVNIALGTARGIYHLHSAFEKPLIHRDVKTANILLDQNLEPKLGDFGLVRLGSNGQRSQSIALTTTVFGTSAYMAREAFRGDISVKIDTYSFGVVILELLTGLAPFDEQRDDGHDLVTYIETVCEESIIPLLDKSAGDWGNSTIVGQLFSLSLDCLEDKRRRPNMSDVVQRLQVVMNVSSNCV